MSNEKEEKLRRYEHRIELGLPSRLETPTLVLGVEGSLAGETGHSLSQWMAKTFNKSLDEYDKAIDAIYNETHIGGSRYHHLVDGQHDIFGAFSAVKNVKFDDTLAVEIREAAEHLLRDLMSVSGINPFFSLTESQFDAISDFFANFGISKAYLADAFMVNGVELLGGCIGLCSALLVRKHIRDGRLPENTLSKLAGGMLFSSLVSANPALMPIAAFNLVKSVQVTGDAIGSVKSAGMGALVSGGALMVSSIIGGGWIGCLAATMTAVLVSHALARPEDGARWCSKLVRPARELFASLKEPVGALKWS